MTAKLLPDGIEYAPLRIWPAEGARVGLTICPRCGSALLIDPDDSEDRLEHTDWHERVEAALQP
jgi:hypothetical protein